MTAQIHDSTICRAGVNDSKCDMCRFAEEAAQANSSLSEAEQGLKIDSSPSSASGITIPAAETAFDIHRKGCTICDVVAKQFPDLELFDHQLCPTGRELFRNNPSKSTLPIPTFTSDWDTAPRSRRALVEQEDAAYWYAMGQRAKDIEWKLAWNQELRALACVAREKVGR